jgi:hypothetical protein
LYTLGRGLQQENKEKEEQKIEKRRGRMRKENPKTRRKVQRGRD